MAEEMKNPVADEGTFEAPRPPLPPLP